MIALIKKNKEIILYTVFGGLTTVVNYIVYFLFRYILDCYYLISNIIAWIVAVLFAYITNKYFVFEQKNNKITLKEFGGFVGGRIFSGGVEMFLLFTFVDLVKLNDMIAKIIIGVIVVILNYFVSKLFVFKEKKDMQ